MFGKQVRHRKIREKGVVFLFPCELERGICFGTVVLWLLFVWLEASVRLREIKTIDLCRPFAAHWYSTKIAYQLSFGCLPLFSIGYPMVTLGFGFKTYLAYKWRLVGDLFSS